MAATTDLKRDTLRILRRRRSRRSPRRFLRDLAGTMAAAMGRAAPPLPGVIVPGTMRGGTTSLFHYLAGHPQIAPSLVKEVHYFDLHFARGPGWYRRQFPARRSASAQGLEASPYYLYEPRVPARLRALVPDVKLVFLLRDPIARAYSHYRKNRRDGREPLDFAAAIAAEEERLAGEEERMLDDPTYVSDLHRHYSYVGRGHYALQLRRWQEHFPAAQMLVVDAGDLYAAPRRTLARVVAFLGLDPWEPAAVTAHNAGGECTDPPAAAAARLAAHFAPHQRQLVDLLGWCPSPRHESAVA